MTNIGKWEEPKPKAKAKEQPDNNFMTGNTPGDHEIRTTNTVKGKNAKEKKGK